MSEPCHFCDEPIDFDVEGVTVGGLDICPNCEGDHALACPLCDELFLESISGVFFVVWEPVGFVRPGLYLATRWPVHMAPLVGVGTLFEDRLTRIGDAPPREGTGCDWVCLDCGARALKIDVDEAAGFLEKLRAGVSFSPHMEAQP